MWKELWEKRDAENSTTNDDNVLAISNSWLPLLSTLRINMHFPQTFDHTCCWANNLGHYRGESFPAYLQSCFALFFKDVFYRPTFEEGINASWSRQKLSTFSSIWKIALSSSLERKRRSVSVRKPAIPTDTISKLLTTILIIPICCSLFPKDLQTPWK